MKIDFIGLGGVGTIIVNNISKYLFYEKNISEDITICMVDGDEYEPKNKTRQEFNEYENKADSKTKELTELYGSKILYKSIPIYIKDKNINSVIEDGDIVMVAVDNHKTRRVIAEYFKTDKIKNIIAISGGNEWLDGNIQMYYKQDGIDILPNLDKYHYEIREPEDKAPDELSCEELQMSEPQLLFTNMITASYMCVAFYNMIVNKQLKYSEMYYDLETLKSDSRVRNP